MTDKRWDEFLHWARVVHDAIDLEAKELAYKRQTAGMAIDLRSA